MAVTEQDYKQYRDQANKQQVLQRATTQRMVEQAEVKAALLTGHPQWDWYLSLLQDLLNKAEQQVLAYQDALTRAFTEENRTVAQIHLHRALAARDTLVECMALPKQVMHGSDTHSDH